MSGSGNAIAALIPLVICGFIFNLLVYPLRYFTVRAEGQRLFFMSAGSGLVLGSVFFPMGDAFARVQCVPYFCWLPGLSSALDDGIPLPGGSNLALTFIGSVLLANLVNLALKLVCSFKSGWHWPAGSDAAEWIYAKLSDRLGSPLAKLLRRAANEQKLVMVTLQSRKVYCGRVFEAPANLDDDGAYFQLLPKFSAFRDKDTLRLGSRTDYPAIALWEAQQAVSGRRQVLKRVQESEREAGLEERPRFQDAIRRIEDEINLLQTQIAAYGYSKDVRPDDWLKIIPVDEVESISFFDLDAYESWFKAEGPEARRARVRLGGAWIRRAVARRLNV